MPATFTLAGFWVTNIQHNCPPSGRAFSDSLLREQLASGPVPARDIEECARAHMISRRTLMRARAKLGIVSEKTGFDGRWALKLPEECQGGPKSASQKTWHPSENLAPFDANGGDA